MKSEKALRHCERSAHNDEFLAITALIYLTAYNDPFTLLK